MRVFVAASVLAAAALTVGVKAALPEAPAVPSPLSVVTTALARTAAKSYTFSLDSTRRFPGNEQASTVVSGAFDLRHNLGTELLTARSPNYRARAEIRFIGAYLYSRVSGLGNIGKPWDKSLSAASAAGGMPPGHLFGFVSDRPVSPAWIGVMLKSADAAVHDSGPVSGPGWTGIKYTFAARLYSGRESVSGTVYVDQHGRARHLMTITTEEARSGHTTFTTDRELTFGDFGVPVLVTAPPSSQVEYTSSRPYWGFYF